MRLRVACLLVLAGTGLLSWAGRAAGEDAPRVEPELQKRIDEAIERGARWLRGRQLGDGSFPGFGDRLSTTPYHVLDVGLNALVVQTLAHCGARPDDEAVRKCLDFCRFHYSAGPRSKGSLNLKGNDKVYTYTAATLILALLALHAEEDEGVKVRYDRYGNPVPPRSRKPCRIPSRDRNWIEELVGFLLKHQVQDSGGWRYPGNPVDSVPADTDLSNTQYALLALDAAARCRFVVPVDTWKRAAEYLLREQEEEGVEVPIVVENETWEPGREGVERFREAGRAQARGWCYLPGQASLSTGSMTCAGVTCLGIVKEWLWAEKALDAPLRRRVDRGLLDGLAWLQDHFTVEDNPDPPGNMWHYYYLYGLERTGAKTGVRWIGRHDWYREGALHLLQAQESEGGWRSAADSGKPADHTESEITQTCFALLFLKRATRKPLIPVAPPVVTGGD